MSIVDDAKQAINEEIEKHIHEGVVELNIISSLKNEEDKYLISTGVKINGQATTNQLILITKSIANSILQNIAKLTPDTNYHEIKHILISQLLNEYLYGEGN